jgi:hypothetical protein
MSFASNPFVRRFPIQHLTNRRLNQPGPIRGVWQIVCELIQPNQQVGIELDGYGRLFHGLPIARRAHPRQYPSIHDNVIGRSRFGIDKYIRSAIIAMSAVGRAGEIWSHRQVAKRSDRN